MKTKDIVTECADGAWDIYSVYCTLIGEDAPEDFKEAPKYMRDSFKDIIKTIMSGDFSGEAIDGEQLHSNWVVFMKDHSWTWGVVLDEAAQTHPSLLSYELLPVEQRCKADLLAACIKGLLASIIMGVTMETVIDGHSDTEPPDSEPELFEDDDEDDES